MKPKPLSPCSPSNLIRQPSLAQLANYRPELLNIVLMDTQPGAERAVIEQIDKKLEQERINFQNHTKTLKPAAAKWGKRTLAIQAVHATVLGPFELATVFTSWGFTATNCISLLRHVRTQRHIIGGIPTLPVALQSQFKHLIQNPDAFLPYYAHSALDTKKITCGHATRRPALVIAEFEISGLLSPVSAGCYMYPIMKLIEERLSVASQGVPPSEQVSGMLVDTQGWSDYTLLLRGSNIEIMLHCIQELRNLSLSDVWSARERLRGSRQERAEAESTDVEYRDLCTLINYENSALRRRFGRLLLALSGDENKSKLHKPRKSSNHLFSATSLTVGALWPFVNHAMQARDSSPLELSAFGWKLSGRVCTNIRIHTKPGHDQDACAIVQNHMQLGIGQEKSDDRIGAGLYSATGRHVLTLSGANLVLPEGSPHEPQRDFGKLLGSIYLLRSDLLHKDGQLRGKWLQDGEELGTKATSLISEISTEIYTRLPSKELLRPRNARTPLKEHLLTGLYLDKIQRMYVDDAVNFAEQDGRKALRARLVSTRSCHELSQITALWCRELKEPTNAHRMFELLRPFEVWRRSAREALQDEKITSAEMEAFIREYTIPFEHAVLQRALSGFTFSEGSDYISEFKGGLCQWLTGIDGLLKSGLGLICAPDKCAILSYISTVSRATVSVAYPRSTNGDVLSAIASLNSTHLVHPIRIQTILHEAIHVVTCSSEFCSLIESLDGGELLGRLLRDPADPKVENSLSTYRLQEILVEYFLGWLLFEDEPRLYTFTYLAQFYLHTDSYSNKSWINNKIMVEHLSRAYVVERMLENGAHPPIDAEELVSLDSFEAWWSRNSAFVSPDGEEDRVGLMHSTWQHCEEWMASIDSMPSLNAILRATTRYFEGSGASPRGESFKYRRRFLQRLRKSMKSEAGASEPCIREKLEELWTEQKGRAVAVHIIFSSTDGRDGKARSLEARTLEAFIANLVLIRSFYAVLHAWAMNAAEGERDVLLKRDRSNQGLPIITSRSNPIMWDRLRGTLFTIGRDAHERHLALRYALLKSIWHVAETLKHTEMLSALNKPVRDQ